MYYFLPSWYSQGETWSRYEDNWYLSEEVPEFDDTVGQVRLFSQAGERVTILSLAYNPGLRRFLHLIGEGGVPYWSAFDTLQGIQRRSIGLYSYKEMAWPRDIAWTYTPVALQGFVKEELFAQVEFGAGGSMIYIDRFVGKDRVIRNFFDDRGFLSSRLLLKEGEPIRQEFFDELGRVQFTHDKRTDMVQVSETAHYPFARLVYDSMGDMLEEALYFYTERKFLEEDALIIASDLRHNEMALRSPGLGVRVLSFYENRYPLEDVDQLRKEVELSDMVITDTQILTEGICAICGIKRRRTVLKTTPSLAGRSALGAAGKIGAAKDQEDLEKELSREQDILRGEAQMDAGVREERAGEAADAAPEEGSQAENGALEGEEAQGVALETSGTLPSVEDLPGSGSEIKQELVYEEEDFDQEDEEEPSGYLGSYPVPWRPVFDIPPYDARLSLGHSQTLWETKILMPAGDMDRETFEEALSRVLSYLAERERAVLVISIKGGSREKQRLVRWIKRLMDALGIDLPMDLGTKPQGENETAEEENRPAKILFCGADEESIRVALGDCRVVLDLSAVPRLYVQIAAISAGVPQIAYATSRYVQDHKNGYIIHSLEEIEKALDYYLEGLSNWNQALIVNVNKIASYTDGRIVAHWKDALERIR